MAVVLVSGVILAFNKYRFVIEGKVFFSASPQLQG